LYSANGFRSKERVLAQHLAGSLNGHAPARPPVSDVVAFLLRELSSAPELWVQKGYLCRVVAAGAEGFVDEDVVPLAHFLDSSGPDAVAASVEVDDAGRLIPMVYVRRGAEVAEHQLEPHPLHEYESENYRRELALLLAPVLGSA